MAKPRKSTPSIRRLPTVLLLVVAVLSLFALIAAVKAPAEPLDDIAAGALGAIAALVLASVFAGLLVVGVLAWSRYQNSGLGDSD